MDQFVVKIRYEFLYLFVLFTLILKPKINSRAGFVKNPGT
jgi:hypothetical protein